MTAMSPTMNTVPSAAPAGELLFNAIRDIVRNTLAPLTVKIDQGHYPAEVLRALGAAGAFRQHLASQNGRGEYDLQSALKAMDIVSQEC
jgi:hypothetical protein